SAPMQILEGCELAAMTLEYRRECRKDSVLQSLTSVLDKGASDLTHFGNVECQHVLRLENGGEVVKGRTEWRPKFVNGIGSLGGFPADSAA
ncbi:Palmitoyl-acyl carrier protein thioesterase, chloroplastic, partial [Datura stramonium]|nr:Palmitoyl-acyl carrier protein thioesterase, chloroplastic [Datura stramonium]